ncbi:hypothetical protein [Streptomyces sp. NPDC005780]
MTDQDIRAAVRALLAERRARTYARTRLEASARRTAWNMTRRTTEEN